MKGIILTILIIVLVVLFGTWPLAILSKIFEFLGSVMGWLADFLDVFGWNGMM